MKNICLPSLILVLVLHAPALLGVERLIPHKTYESPALKSYPLQAIGMEFDSQLNVGHSLASVAIPVRISRNDTLPGVAYIPISLEAAQWRDRSAAVRAGPALRGMSGLISRSREDLWPPVYIAVQSNQVLTAWIIAIFDQPNEVILNPWITLSARVHVKTPPAGWSIEIAGADRSNIAPYHQGFSLENGGEDLSFDPGIRVVAWRLKEMVAQDLRMDYELRGTNLVLRWSVQEIDYSPMVGNLNQKTGWSALTTQPRLVRPQTLSFLEELSWQVEVPATNANALFQLGRGSFLIFK